MSFWEVLLTVLGAAAVAMCAAAILDKPRSIYKDRPEERNPFEGRRVRFVPDDADTVNADGKHGHLEEIYDPPPENSSTFYVRIVKRTLDIILSFLALVALSPLLLILSIAVYLDDPGPIFFAQKRIGKNKRYFVLHKFRSMKMSTPHDVPTHMLENPESCLTRTGKLLRTMSLDELPQLWDIFIGNMSLVGPRPALWNQDILTACRDEYGANDVTPGLTGWAQVNGRDELSIEEKARLDGDYCRNITIQMDTTCILMTIVNVLKHKGVIEGGTGAMEKYIESRRKEIEEKKNRS